MHKLSAERKDYSGDVGDVLVDPIVSSAGLFDPDEAIIGKSVKTAPNFVESGHAVMIQKLSLPQQHKIKNESSPQERSIIRKNLRSAQCPSRSACR